jgi:hypothetical protein
MVAMVISARGQTRLYFVPETVEVNGQFFINHILKQIVEKDIPRLYPGEEHKVTIHMDGVGSHVCSETTDWMKSREVKYIPKQEWMSNSPDLSPMDFGINSIFKNLLSEKRASTLDGMKRVIKPVWSKFPLGVQLRTMKSWGKRVELMVERKGYHIENVLEFSNVM